MHVLPEKYATLRVNTSKNNSIASEKTKMDNVNDAYKVGMLVRIRLRGVWRKAKIVDRSGPKILVVYKGDRGFSEEWITPSARNNNKKEASKNCNSLGEKLNQMRRNEIKNPKRQNFNWRIQRWLDSSDGLSDGEKEDEKEKRNEADMLEKQQDTKCPETHDDDRKHHPIDFTVRDFLSRDKKQFKRHPVNNNVMESKYRCVPSPPKRPSFMNTFDRNLLEKIRVSESELRKKLNYHRYQ